MSPFAIFSSDKYYKTFSLLCLLIVTHVAYREASRCKPRNRKVRTHLFYVCQTPFKQWYSVVWYSTVDFGTHWNCLKEHVNYICVCFNIITVRSTIVSTSSSLAVMSTVSPLVLIWTLVMKTAGSMVTLKVSSTTLPGAKYVSPAARAAERSVLSTKATGLSGEPGGGAIGILISDMFSPHTEQERRS